VTHHQILFNFSRCYIFLSIIVSDYNLIIIGLSPFLWTTLWFMDQLRALIIWLQIVRSTRTKLISLRNYDLPWAMPSASYLSWNPTLFQGPIWRGVPSGATMTKRPTALLPCFIPNPVIHLIPISLHPTRSSDKDGSTTGAIFPHEFR